MQHTKQQEEINKRFDEKFKWFFDNQTNESLKNTTTPDDIKSFIQSEISLAVEQERERAIEAIKKEQEKTRLEQFTVDTIIDLINNK